MSDAITAKEKARKRAHYLANRDKYIERAKNRYTANREQMLAYAKEWAKVNPSKVAANRKRWATANPDKDRASKKKWEAANQVQVKTYRKAYLQQNRARFNEYVVRRQHALKQQTPAWADLDAMRAIYEEAHRLSKETGIKHHVDHIIPLRGKLVSGLHVPANIRPIPQSENARKHNKFEVV